MYCRTITFTLLAPSIWPLIEAVAKTTEQGEYNRYLMRANNNSGVVIETFATCLLYTSPSPRDS